MESTTLHTHLILVGLMGAGKTTMANRLSPLLARPVVLVDGFDPNRPHGMVEA